MIEVWKKFTGKGAADGYPLSKNRFLESFLVEMVGENYRQLVSEAIIRSDGARKTELLLLDPPLRANERVTSALVQTALSRVAIRSRTEVRVEREGAANGRIDHLAWYANHVIGIELKVARMALRLGNADAQAPSSDGEEKILLRVGNPWGSVVDQSTTAAVTMGKLRDGDGRLYPRPLLMPLLLVVGQRRIKVSAIQTMEDNLDEYRRAFIKALPEDADYLAIYTPPKEHRIACERSFGTTDREKDGVMYVPFYAFLSKKVLVPK